MLPINKDYLLKISLAIVGAYLASFLLTKTILFTDRPGIRAEFHDAIVELPGKIIGMPGALMAYVRNGQTTLLNPFSPTAPSTEPVVYTPPAYTPPETNPPGGIISQPTAAPFQPTQPLWQQLPTTPPGQPTNHPLPTNPPPPTLAPPPTSTPEPPAPPPSALAAEFLQILNAERARNSTQTLHFNAALNKASQAYADVLYSCDHYQGGTNPFQRARDAGYPTMNMGENLTCGGRISAQSAFNAWMNSPPHKANMLNPSFRSAGVGIGNYGWVLNVGAY